MIVKYKYFVDSDIRFQADIMFEFKGRNYEFELDNKGFLIGILVSIKADADQYAPQISILNDDNAKYHIHIKDVPGSLSIKEEIRNLEGMLSLFGMNEINLSYPEISWIPECEDEKAKINIPKYRVDTNKEKPLSELLPSDIMARALIAAYDSFEWQIPFTFYRKAMTDYKNGWFLEACYDYYFLLEYLFADGKFKTNEVKRNFINAQDLQISIQQFLQDQDALTYIKTISQKKYNNIIKDKTSEEISGFFVKLRGEIHHQSNKNKRGWHPARQQDFKFEAELFANVCFNLMMKVANDLMFDPNLNLLSLKCFKKLP